MSTPFEIVSPVDGSRAVAGHFLSIDEALSELSRAERVHEAFRRTSIEERVALCLRVAELFRAAVEEFGAEVTRAMGKPALQAQGEIRGMCERIETICKNAPTALNDKLVEPKEGFTRFIRREPLGVVMDIAAWNYPYLVATNVVIPAVLGGNAVLLKHAPQTACVGRQFEEIFQKAGAPEGLVTNCMVEHEVADALFRTRRIAHVGFTGSVRGGAEVYSRVAQAGFTTCVLEMGGKDAALVLDDVDLEKVAAHLADGAFYNAGQSCCAVERVYVPRKQHDAFVEALVAETHKLKLGNPFDDGTTLGPVVNEAAAQRIQLQITEALALGARKVSDDVCFTVPNATRCYLPPRVFTNVTHQMALMKDETFGPLVGVMPYDSLDDAIHLVNDSTYGLTASIWTHDEERATQVGQQLEVGTLYMNRCDSVDADLPWASRKDSGMGFTLSEEGITAFTRPKSFHLRHRY